MNEAHCDRGIDALDVLTTKWAESHGALPDFETRTEASRRRPTPRFLLTKAVLRTRPCGSRSYAHRSAGSPASSRSRAHRHPDDPRRRPLRAWLSRASTRMSVKGRTARWSRRWESAALATARSNAFGRRPAGECPTLPKGSPGSTDRQRTGRGLALLFRMKSVTLGPSRRTIPTCKRITRQARSPAPRRGRQI